MDLSPGIEVTILVGAVVAGFMGALMGLGGGVLIIPMLTALGVDIRHAIAASIVAVIATSCGNGFGFARHSPVAGLDHPRVVRGRPRRHRGPDAVPGSDGVSTDEPMPLGEAMTSGPRPGTERPGGQDESRRLEARIAGVLRTGVLLAAALLAAGLPWITFRRLPPGTPGPSVGTALRDVSSLHPETLAALGVVVLVATPILQLLTSAP